ncbi:mRNA-decapping enzyme-like protein [Zea mays]|uniref:mRNA-decapping enzyme-like protein n=1 Tax=Zea mays TaxID=4577 RepID=A0A1D6EN67_MAIZE|nr:mRNA-decapping enzyme-like protein [Zea mays]
MSHGGGGGRAKVTPNLAVDGEGTRTLNLTVLQRLDHAVEDILITAAHVTLYDFDTDINQWSRKDVEGSLFVVKRNAQPRFQFIVMNRRNTDNLVEDLLGDFEYQLLHLNILGLLSSRKVLPCFSLFRYLRLHLHHMGLHYFNRFRHLIRRHLLHLHQS